MKRPFTPREVRKILTLYRVFRWSYARIAHDVGRNVSSIGYLIRREDMREENELVAEEEDAQPRKDSQR